MHQKRMALFLLAAPVVLLPILLIAVLAIPYTSVFPAAGSRLVGLFLVDAVGLALLGTSVTAMNFYVVVLRYPIFLLRRRTGGEGLKQVSLVYFLGTFLLVVAARIFYWSGHACWMWVALGIGCLDAGGAAAVIWIPAVVLWKRYVPTRERREIAHRRDADAA